MDNRVLLLAVPSLAILGLLVSHSFLTLPRGRAAAFWASAVTYGILRGVFLQWVIEHGLGSSFPYTIRNPLFPVFGVPVQEIAGWAIVSYIGWWLGARFSRRAFAQIAWACLFLGAISWAVESAAVAVGWWRWTVPVTQSILVNVPFIGLVDWLFVGIDFLLPFVALTAPGLRRSRWRFATLLAFPLHFGGHAFVGNVLESVPIPAFHLIHWILISTVAWLAMRSPAVELPFGEEEARDRAWMPLAGLFIILINVTLVDAWMLRRPELLPSILPALAVALQAMRPASGYAVGAVAAAAGLWLAPLALAAAPAATAGILELARRRRRFVPVATLALIGLTAYHVHSASARDQGELVRRLDAALAARDRGDLESARRALTALCAEFPGSHVPPSLLGELDYRTDRLDEASRLFAAAVAIKQDYKDGFRYLAVIDLRRDRNESAARYAQRGLEIDGQDFELAYLWAHARGVPYGLERLELMGPRSAHDLASLAFEVGDGAGAAAVLDRALDLWPEYRPLYSSRVKLAVQAGDGAAARRVLDAWRRRFPQDAEARQFSRGGGME